MGRWSFCSHNPGFSSEIPGFHFERISENSVFRKNKNRNCYVYYQDKESTRAAGAFPVSKPPPSTSFMTGALCLSGLYHSNKCSSNAAITGDARNNAPPSSTGAEQPPRVGAGLSQFRPAEPGARYGAPAAGGAAANGQEAGRHRAHGRGDATTRRPGDARHPARRPTQGCLATNLSESRLSTASRGHGQRCSALDSESRLSTVPSPRFVPPQMGREPKQGSGGAPFARRTAGRPPGNDCRTAPRRPRGGRAIRATPRATEPPRPAAGGTQLPTTTARAEGRAPLKK